MFMPLESRLYIMLRNIFTMASMCFFLTSCNQEEPATSNTSRQNEVTDAKLKQDRLAARQTEAALAGMSLDELRKLASTSLKEQRLYAPAGNNVVEYYLAVRKKTATPDALTESALMDLTPYTVIAAEQALSRDDLSEAIRLRDLIAAVDANAPALPRISQAIADGLKNTESMAAAEAKREQEVLLAAEQAALETQQKTQKTQAVEPLIKPATPTIETAEPSTPIASAPLQSIPAPAASPSIPRSNVIAPTKNKTDLVAVRTPDPVFPNELLNRGLSGAVEIEFVVQRTGEVSEVRVVNSSQRAFNRNVVQTVKRWKFGPLDAPMTVRRSFNFNNPT